MSAKMDDAGNAPKGKSSEIQDLPTDEVVDEEAGTVKASQGVSAAPAIKPSIM